MFPRMNIYLDKIRHNAHNIHDLCKKNNILMYAVTKVTSADIKVTESIIDAGIDYLADSRISNIIKLKKHFPDKKYLLLRVPMISELEKVAEYCNSILVSEKKTLYSLDKILKDKKKSMDAILMIDVGDLREGIWYENIKEKIDDLKSLENVNISGLGVNLACYGGVIPTPEKMFSLIKIKELFEKEGFNIKILSGGNSSSLPLLLENSMPNNINMLRVGEAIMLGRNVINRDPWPKTFQDTFTFEAEIIEIQKKPSIPQGKIGQDAFGNTPEYKDRGTHHRAILAAGRQDVDVEGLIPMGDFEVLGASSDHIIIDIENIHDKLQIGDTLEFMLSYGALLACSTSQYVEKNYIK